MYIVIRGIMDTQMTMNISVTELTSIFISLLALTLSIYTYFHGLNRERTLDTISAFSNIRLKYYRWNDLNNEQRARYMSELEFFATAANKGMYDINIVKTMSGTRMVKLYDRYLQSYTSESGTKYNNPNYYSELEEMIEKLRKN